MALVRSAACLEDPALRPTAKSVYAHWILVAYLIDLGHCICGSVSEQGLIQWVLETDLVEVAIEEGMLRQTLAL
jgi:hypothetical protein